MYNDFDYIRCVNQSKLANELLCCKAVTVQWGIHKLLPEPFFTFSCFVQGIPPQNVFKSRCKAQCIFDLCSTGLFDLGIQSLLEQGTKIKNFNQI